MAAGTFILAMLAVFFLTGCLRSSLTITRSPDGGLILTDTLMRSQVNLMLRLRDTPKPEPEEVLVGTMYQQQAERQIKADPVVDGDFLGMIVSMPIDRANQFAPSFRDLYGGDLEDPVQSHPILAFTDTGDDVKLRVVTDGIRSLTSRWIQDSVSESDLVQFRGFGTMLTMGGRVRIMYGTTLVAMVDFEQFMDYLRYDDDLTRALMSLSAMTDQQLADFVASFPRSVIDIPSITAIASPTTTIREKNVQPAPSQEDLRNNLIERITSTCTSIYPWLHKDIPEEIKRMMPMSVGPGLEQDPLRFGAPLDTFLTQAKNVGLEIKESRTNTSRTITIHVREGWHRQYDLVLEAGRGLTTATEIAWFEEEPLFRLKGQREEIAQTLDQAGTKYTIEKSTEREIRVTYTDRYEGPMEYHQFIERRKGEPSKPWALITTKKHTK